MVDNKNTIYILSKYRDKDSENHILSNRGEIIKNN